MATVAFDLDDTLYDRTLPLRKTFSLFGPASNLTFEDFYRVFQRNSDLAFERVKDGLWTLEQSHIFRIKETLKELGIAISDSEAMNFQNQYSQNQGRIELFPHIPEILDFLHSKKIQTIIITNGPSSHQRKKFDNLGLSCYFQQEQLIISEEVGIAKPDIRIFEFAEERFNLVKEDTWFIGDNYDFDIVGAANAGWNSIWFNHAHAERDSLIISPSKMVTSTLELEKLLFQLFG